MKAFKYVILKDKDRAIIEASGSINERTKAPALSEIPTELPIEINLDQISYINSTGTGLWIKWLKELIESSEHGPVILSHCPPDFIRVLNLTLDSWPKDFTIDSFYVPLYCDSCEKNLRPLVKNGEHLKEDIHLETLLNLKELCVSSGCEIEPDFLPEVYFRFIKDGFSK